MAFKFAALILMASYIASTSALPPCVCARNLLPVCGSDGVTYANQCKLECAQITKKDLTLAREGSCETEDSGCICPYLYAPICGTDNKSYPNECTLKCQQKTDRSLGVKHQGQCENRETVKVVDISPAAAQPGCICTFEYKPVCGSDGQTYPNKCALMCEKNTKQNLEVERDGECVLVKAEPEHEQSYSGLPPCVCTRELKPVCGTDNVTYSNMCLLNCAASKSETKIELKSRQACEA